jgi:voltage-dependent calcium channel L type alpha-1D
MPDLLIPVAFPQSFKDAPVIGADGDFAEAFLRELHADDVTIVAQASKERKSCCAAKTVSKGPHGRKDDGSGTGVGSAGGSGGSGGSGGVGGNNNSRGSPTRRCCCGDKGVSARVAPSDVDPLDSGPPLVVKEHKVEYYRMTEDHGCIPRGRSLFLFTHNMPCRVMIFNITKHPVFDQFILVAVIIGSILLAWQTPLWDPNSVQLLVVNYINYVLSGIFMAEMIAKIVALGFVLHKDAYLRDPWNVLDFVIVIISVVLVATEDQAELKGLRSLRVLRALRPLRTISRAPQLKIVINALGASIWPILQTLVMISIFFIIFATVGVTYFKGSFYACDLESTFDWPIAEQQYALVLCNELDELSTPSCREWRDLTPQQQQEWAVLPADQEYAAWQNYLDVQSGRVANLTTTAAVVLAQRGTDQEYYEALNVSHFVTANNDGTLTNFIEGPVTSRMICEWLGYDWVMLGDQQFDNILPSLASLYELSTTEGWVDVMWQSADARGLDMEPVRDTNKYAVAFFMAFMVVGTFFAIKLFVGIICDTFAEKRSESDGSSLFATEQQRQWQAIQKIILKLKPFVKKQEPADPFRRCCFRLANSSWFEQVIIGFIVANTVVLSIGYYGQSYEYEFVLDVLNYFIFSLFVLEACIKLIGFGGQYFSTARSGGRDCARYVDGWNVFDLTIVMGTTLGILLSALSSIDIGAMTAIIRTFRLLRIVRLLRGVRGLKVLLNTIVVAMPAVVNVFMLLVLVLVIFAIMGIHLFAGVAHSDSLNEHANFEDFFVALLTLLRGSTGEGWNALMHDMSAEQPGCVDVADLTFNASMCGYCHYNQDPLLVGYPCEDCIPLNGCGNAVAAKIFWYVFTLVVTYMLLNVCVAVILEAWENAETTESAEIKEEALTAYCAEWQKYDPDGKQYMPLTELPMLLQELPAPLGFLEPPATIVEVHGTPFGEDEYFTLQMDDGRIVSVVENGVAIPRKVLRSELRPSQDMGTAVDGPGAGAQGTTGHGPQDLETATLLKRMRVRYNKSTAQAQAEVLRLQLKSQTTKEGLHVVSFLPTAVACAHRSFAQLQINEDLLGE